MKQYGRISLAFGTALWKGFHDTSVSYWPYIVKSGICNPHSLPVKSNRWLISVVLHQPLKAKTKRRFDFLGYHFGPEGLAIAEKILHNLAERAIRHYEQGPPAQKVRRVGEYAQHWVRAGADIEKAGVLEFEVRYTYLGPGIPSGDYLN